MVEKFRNIFKGLDERFGYHIADYEEGDGKKSGDSFTSNYPHTLEMWQAHLDGRKFNINSGWNIFILYRRRRWRITRNYWSSRHNDY